MPSLDQHVAVDPCAGKVRGVVVRLQELGESMPSQLIFVRLENRPASSAAFGNTSCETMAPPSRRQVFLTSSLTPQRPSNGAFASSTRSRRASSN